MLSSHSLLISCSVHKLWIEHVLLNQCLIDLVTMMHCIGHICIKRDGIILVFGNVRSFQPSSLQEIYNKTVKVLSQKCVHVFEKTTRSFLYLYVLQNVPELLNCNSTQQFPFSIFQTNI